MQNQSIAIVYLFYCPYGIEKLKKFLHSYNNNKPYFSNKIYIIFKEIQLKESNLEQVEKECISYSLNYQILECQLPGFDINTYQWVAQQVIEDYLIFFNTNSVLLHPNWCDFYTKHITKNTGAISATASFNSHINTVLQENNFHYNRKLSFKENLASYKMLLKAIFIWPFLYKKFPNPHIRTNAFLINRKVFLTLNIKNPLKSKREAYLAESGRNSITQQLLKKNLTVGVVNNNGDYFDLQEAYKANTFWNNQQENLLVADNQTELYKNANETQKKQLSLLAWGNFK